MIDWYTLGADGLWILGCALGLASLSYSSWEAGQRSVGLHAHLRQATSQGTLSLAGALVCLGLAAGSDGACETGMWLILAIAFLAATGFFRRRSQ